VFVEGRLKLDQWENQQGEKRSKLRVRADRVQFLGAPKRSDSTNTAGGEMSAPEAPSVPSGDDEDIPF
jgi:single-strand DNA-binding protein